MQTMKITVDAERLLPTAVYIDIVITDAIVGVTGIMDPTIAFTIAE